MKYAVSINIRTDFDNIFPKKAEGRRVPVYRFQNLFGFFFQEKTYSSVLPPATRPLTMFKFPFRQRISSMNAFSRLTSLRVTW